jgi:hypothetical protein
MSKIDTPKNAYSSGLIEKHLGYPDDAAIPFDSTYQHSPLYGKVDRNGNSCYLMSDEGSLDNFKDASTFFAVNFVVRAFEDFRKSYRTALIDGALPFNGWQNLTPTSAWVDFENMYADSLEDIRTALVQNYLKEHSDDIHTFDDFMNVCFKFINTHGNQFPITRSSYLLSSAVPRSVSGLEISLKDVGEERDIVREKMVSEDNFASYTYKAASYGFWVDRDSPWVLVANLASHRMQEYSVRSGIIWNPGSASNFHEKYCMKAHLNDMDDIRAFFMGVYREYSTNFPFVMKTKFCGGTTKLRSITREPLVEERYNVQYWMDVLIKIKLAETKLINVVSERQLSRLTRKAMLAYRLYGLERALNVVNSAIKKQNTAFFSPDVVIPLDKPTKKSVYYNQVKPINGKSLYDWM